MDFEFIFDYLFEHACEIILGLEMLFLKIFKKKTPEEIQAKKEQREEKRLENKKKKLRIALEELNSEPSVPALNGGRYLNTTWQDWEKEMKK